MKTTTDNTIRTAPFDFAVWQSGVLTVTFITGWTETYTGTVAEARAILEEITWTYEDARWLLELAQREAAVSN